jgi:hypothetical protein
MRWRRTWKDGEKSRSQTDLGRRCARPEVLEPSFLRGKQEDEWRHQDCFPLRRIGNTMDTLAGAKWFSPLDLKSGFSAQRQQREDNVLQRSVTVEFHS